MTAPIVLHAEDVEALFDGLDALACVIARINREKGVEAASILQGSMQHMRAKFDLAEGSSSW